MAYKRGVGRGVVYCAIDVQWYCNSAGSAGRKGQGNKRMIDSCTKASK